MFKTIDEYLEALRTEMQGSDPALLQDAQADAREHLYTALEAARDKTPDVNQIDALNSIVEEYGLPEETAAAYREIERRTSPALKRATKPKSFRGRVLGVYVDPRTWGALVFMFITFITGFIYFTWAVTGAALSVALLILIVGAPLGILFLISVRGLALMEGRLVEALLGVRMPRRPLFTQPGLKWLERSKVLLADRHTWLSLLYLVLQLPLGIVYFLLNAILLSLDIGLLLAPFGEVLFKSAIITFQVEWTDVPGWALILFPIGGFLLLTLTLHLVRAIGQWHGRYAKALLVS